MKKVFHGYLIAWAVCLALFNVIAFVVPASYTSSFWIGYVFITISFLGQLACGAAALKEERAQKTFYNLSLLRVSYTGLVLSLLAGGVCMAIAALPYWVGIVLCACVLAFNVVAVVKTATAISLVSAMDEKIKIQTFFVKALTVEADKAVAAAQSAELKACAKEVYEAVRYSDPMSNPALANEEARIAQSFDAFTEAVQAQDLETAKAQAETLLLGIRARNQKCKLLK